MKFLSIFLLINLTSPATSFAYVSKLISATNIVAGILIVHGFSKCAALISSKKLR